MKMKSAYIDTFLSAILLSPECRVYRHIILIFVMTVISIYIVVNHPAAVNNITYALYAITGYNVLILSASYINIYLLIPRYLLKEKPLSYFLTVSIMVFSFLVILLIMQIILFKFHKVIQTESWIVIAANFVSSFVILGLMIAGVTTIVLLKHWNLSAQRINQLQEAGLQSELNLLKSQINPHFLFNVINNANVLLKDRQGGASGILFKLEDLLRYQINETVREEIPLTSDIVFIRDYMNLEKIRRDKFEFDISIDGESDNLLLPPLLFIPFIENAVKYSQDSDKESYVHIYFNIQAKELHFYCENSIPDGGIGHHKPGGLGLKNIRRRLELLYPSKHELIIEQQTDKYIVDLQITFN